MINTGTPVDTGITNDLEASKTIKQGRKNDFGAGDAHSDEGNSCGADQQTQGKLMATVYSMEEPMLMTSLLASLQETLTFVQNWQESLASDDNQMNMCEIKHTWQRAVSDLSAMMGQKHKKLFGETSTEE